jgi:hypothetical protein
MTAAARRPHPFCAILRFGGKLTGKRDREFANRNIRVVDKKLPAQCGKHASMALHIMLTLERLANVQNHKVHCTCLSEMLRRVLGQKPIL